VPAHDPIDAPPLAGASSYSAVVDRVAPSVVTIRVEKVVSPRETSVPEPFRDFFGLPFHDDLRAHREGGLGSGVVIRPDGYILTNHHVVSGAGKVRVDLADGRSFPAKIVGSDAASDLAVLHIDATGLRSLAFGDSDRVRVGDVVLAFGNPLGVGQTVTMGIVSAKGRATGVSDGNYEDFLQTDAPINQGNSGGALVNLRGELVGINAQIVSPSGGNIGLGFAIPSAMARAVSEQLTRDGVVHRAKLGVTVQQVTPELAESLGLPGVHGALVSGVEAGSPADHAGLRQGDVITLLDGAPVSDANALRNHIAGSRPGSTVALEVVRQGKTESLHAQLIERAPTESARAQRQSSADPDESSVGMAVTPLTPDVANQLGVAPTGKGVVVTDVDPAGVAAAAGLQPGDVITRVNDRAIASVAALRAALDARSTKPALVLVQRHGANLFVALPRAES
jgi:Do/DeqQ family serine protease